MIIDRLTCNEIDEEPEISIRVKQAKPMVTDGPFAEAKEMVAGFYLLEVRDEQEALEGRR
jgi:hypothetical protein